ncbi:hypothetical protein D0T49_11995 [Paludibacter sp. 221]|nr:hypothetical protein [Paludibacter sp. 221]
MYSCNARDSKNNVTYTVPSYNDFQDVITINGFVEPISSTTLSCPRGVDGIVVFLIEDGTYVEEGDLLCVIEDANLQSHYNQTKVDLENAEANLEKTRADLALQYSILEAQVKNNEAETAIANLDSLQLIYSTPTQRKIKELELRKTAIEKAKYEKKLGSLDIIQQSEIKKRELEIIRLKNRMESVKEIVDKLEIRAPKKGLATRPIYTMTWKKLQVGDNVWNNMPVIVIPEMEKMKVKIMAPEKDFKNIGVNDSVVYTFDAMPGNIAYGKIIKKTPVGRQIVHGSKVKEFEIEASIDSSQVMPEPGFTADCKVILKEVKDTIVIPQIAVFDGDSTKVVYVKNGKTFEERPVVTGMSSQKEVIISEGLSRNEEISLVKPQANLIKSRKLSGENKTNTPVEAEADSIMLKQD